MATVVFLCVHNAGRSQMAAAWAEVLGDGRVTVSSGGSDPAGGLNPVVVQAMAEVGIDIAYRRPRRWNEDDIRDADVIVTMGCGDTCPVFPGKRYEDWDVDDPAGLAIDRVREIRDDIRERVWRLFEELDPDSGRPSYSTNL